MTSCGSVLCSKRAQNAYVGILGAGTVIGTVIGLYWGYSQYKTAHMTAAVFANFCAQNSTGIIQGGCQLISRMEDLSLRTVATLAAATPLLVATGWFLGKAYGQGGCKPPVGDSHRVTTLRGSHVYDAIDGSPI